MRPERKIKEIQKRLRKGEPEGELKEQLKKEGYSSEAIEKFFRPHKYDMRGWYLTFAIIISITGVLIFIENNRLLILILGGLLFFAYYREVERIKREK